MNATDLPSGETMTFESRPVGENQRSSWSRHKVRGSPPTGATLIDLVFPFAEPSVHSRFPSLVNCNDPGLPTTGIHVISPPATDTTPRRRSVAPPATTPFPLPTTRMRSPLYGSSAASPAAALFPLPPPPAPALKAIHCPLGEN